MIAAGGTLARRDTPAARAWRAAAASALLGAVAVAFAPVAVVGLLVAAVGLLLLVIPGAPRDWWGPLTARVGLATLGPMVLLLPWSWSLFAADGPILGATLAPVVDSELWRWVLLVPGIEGFPGLLAGVGFLLAGILGVLFGWRRQTSLVAVLWTARAARLGGRVVARADRLAGVAGSARWCSRPRRTPACSPSPSPRGRPRSVVTRSGGGRWPP
jgi:hypothetical protein